MIKKRVAKIKKCFICEKETSRLGRHIKDHNISEQDYYDSYINKDFNFTKKCSRKDCSELVKFQNINIGYTQFCSTECSMIERNKDNNFKLTLSTNMSRYSNSVEGKSKSLETRNERNKNAFITISNNKGFSEGIFYIMKFNKMIKVGICIYDNDLYHFNNRAYKLKPESFELFKSTINEVAEYELSIKRSFIPVNKSEYFDLSDYDSIKSKLPNHFTVV